MKQLTLPVFWLFVALVTLPAATPKTAPVESPPVEDRGLKISVAANGAPSVRAAAANILASVPKNFLLTFLAGDHATTTLSDSSELASGPVSERAFDHLVLVGLMDDPLIASAWSREAKFDGANAYIFGFGHLKGDIGYVESHRNPFLHSRFVTANRFETEIIIISGTTPRGVEIAANAFLNGLLNGVVAAPGWTRPKSNLLERDPLPADWTAPQDFPKTIGEWSLAGFTQPNEDEYRGVENLTKIAPRLIWRAKYLKTGELDHAGGEKSFENYEAGLHRRASGNSLWMAQWNSSAEAAAAIKAIATEAQLKPVPGDAVSFRGAQPPYANRTDSMGDMAAWTKEDITWMSTLPSAVEPE